MDSFDGIVKELVLEDIIEDAFRSMAFADYYSTINQQYKALGFSDPLTDAQMMDEAWYIVKEFRKYIGKKEAEIVPLVHDLPKLLRTLESYIEKAPEKPEGRKQMVYNIFRDDWIVAFHTAITAYMKQEQEKEDMKNGSYSNDWS